MRKLVFLTTVLLTFFAAALVACGGSSNKSSSNNAPSSKGPDVAPTSAPAAAAPTSAPAAAAAPAVQKIALKAGENGQAYFFSQSEIKVKPGQVEVTLTNDGPDRPHNFVVKKLDGSDLASMDRLNPGQTNSVSFTFASAGTYQFICSLPGHADRGAKGTFVVAN